MNYWRPETLDFQKDVDDATVANEGHHPEEEEEDSKEVGDQWVHWRERAPVVTHDLHHLESR